MERSNANTQQESRERERGCDAFDERLSREMANIGNTLLQAKCGAEETH